MITELLFMASINYIQATADITTREATVLVETIAENTKTEDDFLYFLSMAEVESNFNIYAVNTTSGAYGALQVMPMHFNKKPTPITAIKKGIQQYYYWARLCDIKWTQVDIYCAARHYNGGYKAARTKQTLTYAMKIDRLYDMHKQGLL